MKKEPQRASHYRCYKCGKLYGRDPEPPMVHEEDGGVIIPVYPLLLEDRAVRIVSS